jgi:hypothetical protein
MTQPGWSQGFTRAFKGEFSTGVRATERPAESQIHTDAYDRDKDKLPLLEPLTANEMKLFKRGGFQAVIEDRRFYAREKGDPTWNEIGTKRYGIQAEQRPLSTGRPPDQPQGTQEGAPAGVRVPMPVLPGQDRPGERTTVEQADRGPGQGDRTADGAKEQTPSPESRTVEIRDGRPGNQPKRPTTVQQGQATESPSVLPTLLPANQARGRTGAEEVLAFEAPRVKRGRPKKYASDREKWRTNKRQRRGR